MSGVLIFDSDYCFVLARKNYWTSYWLFERLLSLSVVQFFENQSFTFIELDTLFNGTTVYGASHIPVLPSSLGKTMPFRPNCVREVYESRRTCRFNYVPWQSRQGVEMESGVKNEGSKQGKVATFVKPEVVIKWKQLTCLVLFLNGCLINTRMSYL